MSSQLDRENKREISVSDIFRTTSWEKKKLKTFVKLKRYIIYVWFTSFKSYVIKIFLQLQSVEISETVKKFFSFYIRIKLFSLILIAILLLNWFFLIWIYYFVLDFNSFCTEILMNSYIVKCIIT
jgi:hypothetical protein